MDPIEAIKVTFFQECEEQLCELEAGLLAMEAGDTDPETLNGVFRAVHSIKGGAGAFSLEPLVRFAHVFETTLDDVRTGRLVADNGVVKVMLRAADILADHVRAARDGGDVEQDRSLNLAQALEALSDPSTAVIGTGGDTSGGTGTGAPIDDLAFQPMFMFEPVLADLGNEDLATGDLDGDLGFTPVAIDLGAQAPPVRVWVIGFRPQPGLYAKANDTALLLRELARLGQMDLVLDTAALPGLADLDPEGAYLGWTITLITERTEADIREVFEFVDGDCQLSIDQKSEAPAALPASLPTTDIDIIALIQQAQSVQLAPLADHEGTPPPKPKGPDTAPQAAPQATIRVDLERVDRLIDLVGELVINQAMLAQRVTESGVSRSSTIVMGLDDLEHLTRDIQDSDMAIRAQPVKSVFQRMPRLIREVAAMTGKQVRLVTEGEATEVDKTVIERLTDPITHMIRNAIDHGLETPQERLDRGKSAEGLVRLTAAHRSGRVVIEVSDDGRGIDRPRVRQIALDKGLIDPTAALSDEEIDNLIFMPGFSTASAVSDISGRGVGMDVVKRSIQALGGRIAITSRPGQGSAFTLSLPLTLAVLDGMVVSVCEHTLVAPLTAIIESLQPKRSDVRAIGPDAHVIAIRDAYTPLIDVGVVLGYRKTPLDPTQGVALLVEGEGGARAALVVDAIRGQRQVVIKSLEANYRQVEGIAAATILGDGRVALILDVDAMVASRRRDAPRADLRLAAAG